MSIFITDGLTEAEAKKRYKKRRTAFLKDCKEITVITGANTPKKSAWHMTHSPIYQEPFMLFLTGINQPNCALILNPFSKKNPFTLYLPKKDPKKEFWEGPQFRAPSIDIENLFKDCKALVKTHKRNAIATLWYDPPKSQPQFKDELYAFKNKLKKTVKAPVINIESLHWDHRLILDAIDIKNIKTANKKATEAFKATLKQLPKCKTETEVAGILNGEIQKRSEYGNSFPSIVASGKNACILHYTQNNATLKKNDLLLLDFGLRWHSMPSDISRTLPISGKLNPMQKILHDCVLKTQKTVEKNAKPGTTIDQLNTLCWDTLETHLKTDFIDKGGKLKRPYKKQPHNVSHLIGLMVHEGDPYRNYRTMPLKPGMVISNEPGLYGHFSIKLNGKNYTQDIGIRIEDDLLITHSGCQNLTL